MKVDKSIVELRLNRGAGLFWETAKDTGSRNREGTDSLRRARQHQGRCKGRIGFQVGRMKQRYQCCAEIKHNKDREKFIGSGK